MSGSPGSASRSAKPSRSTANNRASKNLSGTCRRVLDDFRRTFAARFRRQPPAAMRAHRASRLSRRLPRGSPASPLSPARPTSQTRERIPTSGVRPGRRNDDRRQDRSGTLQRGGGRRIHSGEGDNALPHGMRAPNPGRGHCRRSRGTRRIRNRARADAPSQSGAARPAVLGSPHRAWPIANSGA